MFHLGYGRQAIHQSTLQHNLPQAFAKAVINTHHL
jgi:hypothetical protein